MKPDFSPAMLKAFLHARAVARAEFSRTEAEHIAARRAVADEMVALTGLPLSIVRAAFSGRLTDSGARAAIWAALGHFPSDFGIVLGGPAEGGKPDRASALTGRPAGAAIAKGDEQPREAMTMETPA